MANGDRGSNGTQDSSKSSSSDGAKQAPFSGGEDESSTEKEGDDSHLHEDQKSPRLKT